MDDNKLDFSVDIPAAVSSDDNMVLLTSEESEANINRVLQNALASYDPENKMYGSVLDNGTSSQTVTLTLLSQIANGAQSDLTKIRQANSIVAQYTNLDECIGMVASTLWANINTDMRLSYKNAGEGVKKTNLLEKAKTVINDFNNQIDVRSFIRNSILTAWLEGNYICCVRYDGKSNWTLDQYPLGIAELSTYTMSGKPIVQINMEQLKSALQRTILKDKRGKALYFEDTLKEIEASFGKEIVQAYKNKESYCRLNTDYTGVIRVNNFGKLYGLSPVFKALPSALALETLRNADFSLAKAKAKTILHQRMRKECLDKDTKARQYEQLAWNHKNLMSAWKASNVIISTPPDVEEIAFVCPKNEEVSTDKQEAYTRKIMSSLGVSFLSANSEISTTVAKLSFTVLMNIINSIGEQVERVLENFYRIVLRENHIDAIYLPTVRIIDSEMLDAKTRAELAKLLLGTFGASRQTAFETVGVDLEDEVARRKKENAENLSEVFTPYPTSYTTPGDTESGRPTSDDPQDETKQVEDEETRKKN